MKRLIVGTLVLILALVSIETKESTLPKELKVFGYKVDFRTAFKVLMEHEGYYANHPLDRGRETYAGITRVYNPNWYGWRYVDSYKFQKKLKLYQRIPELDLWVLDYYLDIWVKEHFYELQDQEVANYVFDFRINATVGAKLTRRVLNTLGRDDPIKNQIDSTTIAAINSIDKDLFLTALSKKRDSFYHNIVKRDSTQKVFLKHWLKRSQLNKHKHEKKTTNY